jgi:amidophosphoribosyltransferase
MKPKEECGIFAVVNTKKASYTIYNGLSALQHRGQESCGIATTDNKHIYLYKNMGLVHSVFNLQNLEDLHGDTGIGHLRYSTTGSSTLLNAQPLIIKTSDIEFAIAHNGNLVNSKAIIKDLEKRGCVLTTTTDTELIGRLIAL